VLRRSADPEFDSRERERQRLSERERKRRKNTDDTIDVRVTIMYPQWLRTAFGEALMEFCRSLRIPYVASSRAYELFNHILYAVVTSNVLNTALLELRRDGDGKPLGLKSEYQKVLNEVCREEKRHAQVGNSIWYPKVQQLDCETGGEECMTGDQNLLEAIAAKVVAKRQTQGVDTQDVAQNRRGTLRVNTNEKVDCTFEEEELKDEESWKVQMNCAGKKKNFAPDGTRCPSVPTVKKYAERESGTERKRKRASRKANNNFVHPHMFEEEEELKHLTGCNKRKTKQGTWQYLAPLWNEVSWCPLS